MKSSVYRNLTVAALLMAVAGILIQILSDVDYPTVPPGIVILIVAAGIVAFVHWRWTPLVGVAVGIFLLVGFVVSGAIVNLMDPGQPGIFIGTWIQFLAVVVATFAGIAATASDPGRRNMD